MFRYCENLSEINMLNWDMSRLERKRSGINYLFLGCGSLKNIKMSSNFSKGFIIDKDEKIFAGFGRFLISNEDEKIFTGLPNGGTFTWKKGINCDNLLKLLPVSWNRVTE